MSEMTLPLQAVAAKERNQASRADAQASAPSLLDLMADGFYLLLLIKRGSLPTDAVLFTNAVRSLLESVQRNAQRLNISSEDVYAASYAFCAAVDETILSLESPIRGVWECQPLQLQLFGDQLAGAHFFEQLEGLRGQGASRVASLEVFYQVLLLGFEGKYRIEGPEKLGYLIARLGEEVGAMRGRQAGVAPHAVPDDRVAHVLRRQLPIWLPVLILLFAATLGYLAFAHSLSRQISEVAAQYTNIVQLPARTAHLTITLP